MTDPSFCLYCKSYEGDVRRVVLLAESVRRFNRDGLQFYVSVPAADRSLFASKLGNDVELINDEDIIRANPRAEPSRYVGWDGRLSQQVIKSEFWRLIPCDAYLCIDSDSIFLKDFFRSDFVHPDGHCYTVIHQQKELLQMAANKGQEKVLQAYYGLSERMKKRFGRTGADYQFGPPPMPWARRVWEDLDNKMLIPEGITLWDAIEKDPSELRWYGESLLKFRSIPLHPIEPLFRFYYYDWYWQALRRGGETDETLKRNYLGVVYQSNWMFELDFGTKTRPLTSRILRRIKRELSRFR